MKRFLIITLIVLTILPKIELIFRRKTQYFELHVELDDRSNLKDLVNFKNCPIVDNKRKATSLLLEMIKNKRIKLQ